MISKSEKILMSLNNKQSNFTKWQPQNLPPRTQRVSKQQENDNNACFWWLRLVILGLSNQAERYFLVWWSLTSQEKGLFQNSKELKL